MLLDDSINPRYFLIALQLLHVLKIVLRYVKLLKVLKLLMIYVPYSCSSYNILLINRYSQNTPNLKYSITPFIQAHLPLLREMPDSSLLRLIEAMSIRFKDSAPIQSLTDQTLQEQACFLQSIGISVIILSFFLKNSLLLLLPWLII